MSNTAIVPKHIETLIRRTIPGSAKMFADARKVARAAVLASDSKTLRDQAGDDGIISGGFRAVADALDKVIADRAKTAARNAELRHAIENGCPQCGAKLRRNLSLTGWWQCGQYGSDGFRADNSKPQCSFQGFLTE